jgi:hypothetical protein
LINPHHSHSAIGNISLPNFWPDKNKSTNLRLMQYAADVRFFFDPERAAARCSGSISVAQFELAIKEERAKRKIQLKSVITSHR